MGYLTCEREEGGAWTALGAVGSQQGPGMLIDQQPGERQTYLFAVSPEGTAGVICAAPGEVQPGWGAQRVLDPTLRPGPVVAHLRPGEEYAARVHLEPGGPVVPVRWRMQR